MLCRCADWSSSTLTLSTTSSTRKSRKLSAQRAMKGSHATRTPISSSGERSWPLFVKSIPSTEKGNSASLPVIYIYMSPWRQRVSACRSQVHRHLCGATASGGRLHHDKDHAADLPPARHDICCAHQRGCRVHAWQRNHRPEGQEWRWCSGHRAHAPHAAQ